MTNPLAPSNARQIAADLHAALRRNTDDYYDERINYDEFAARAIRIHDLAPRRTAVGDALFELLRAALPSAGTGARS